MRLDVSFWRGAKMSGVRDVIDVYESRALQALEASGQTWRLLTNLQRPKDNLELIPGELKHAVDTLALKRSFTDSPLSIRRWNA